MKTILNNNKLANYDNIYEVIQTVHSSIFIKQRLINNKSHSGENAWITEEIRKKIKIKLYNKMKKNKNTLNITNYKIHKNELNMYIKTQKLKYYSNILNNSKDNKKCGLQ